jgi:hypothetical protein
LKKAEEQREKEKKVGDCLDSLFKVSQAEAMKEMVEDKDEPVNRF